MTPAPGPDALETGTTRRAEPGTDPSGKLAARAGRLLRWYPRAWRARYGAEFTELLLADLAEQPRSWRRTADVAMGGTLARLSQAGLGGRLLDPAAQATASLASLGCAVAVFLMFATMVWSQLVIGWQWAPPDSRATTLAVLMMSATMALFPVLAVLAAVPLIWCLARALHRGLGRRLAGPAVLALVSAAVLVAGARHIENGWPGTGGQHWPRQGLVPGGVAAFGWASTLSVSSYWAHPAALLAFPASEIAWMAISPVALAGLAAGLAMLVRRLDLPAGVLRYQARLGSAAAATMAALLTGATCWVLAGGPGPRDLFRAGAVDELALAVMALALAVGWRALHRAHAAGLPGHPAARHARPACSPAARP